MNTQICKAITNKNVIEFYYDGGTRIVEPHCYGIHNDTGNELLCGYQTGGYSKSGNLPDWRLYTIPEISGLRITDDQFSNARHGYKPNDSRMSRIFCQL